MQFFELKRLSNKAKEIRQKLEKLPDGKTQEKETPKEELKAPLKVSDSYRDDCLKLTGSPKPSGFDWKLRKNTAINQGERHGFFVKACLYAIRKKMRRDVEVIKEEIIAGLWKRNTEQCSPPMPYNEFSEEVEKVFVWALEICRKDDAESIKEIERLLNGEPIEEVEEESDEPSDDSQIKKEKTPKRLQELEADGLPAVKIEPDELSCYMIPGFPVKRLKIDFSEPAIIVHKILQTAILPYKFNPGAPPPTEGGISLSPVAIVEYNGLLMASICVEEEIEDAFTPTGEAEAASPKGEPTEKGGAEEGEKEKGEREKLFKWHNLGHDGEKEAFIHGWISIFNAGGNARYLRKYTNRKTGEIDYGVKPLMPEEIVRVRRKFTMQAEDFAARATKTGIAATLENHPLLQNPFNIVCANGVYNVDGAGGGVEFTLDFSALRIAPFASPIKHPAALMNGEALDFFSGADYGLKRIEEKMPVFMRCLRDWFYSDSMDIDKDDDLGSEDTEGDLGGDNIEQVDKKRSLGLEVERRIKEKAEKQFLQKKTQLRRWIAYTLTRSNHAQKIAFFWGVAGAGKSTLISLIEELVGDKNSVGTSLDNFDDSFAGEQLIGARLVTVQEVMKGSKGALEVLATMMKAISGKDKFSVKRKNKVNLKIKNPDIKFMLIGNEAPRFNDSGNAFARRVLPFYFPRSVTEFGIGVANSSIDELLRAELSWILAWACVGAKELWEAKKRGLTGFEDTISEEDARWLKVYSEKVEPLGAAIEEMILVNKEDVSDVATMPEMVSAVKEKLIIDSNGSGYARKTIEIKIGEFIKSKGVVSRREWLDRERTQRERKYLGVRINREAIEGPDKKKSDFGEGF